MSLRTMDRVWTHSRESGARLLLLLALADRADDDGFCWPGIDELARRARISRRQAQRVLVSLEESGEVYIVRGVGGRGHTPRYVVTVGLTVPEIAATLQRRFKMDEMAAVREAQSIVELREKGDILDRKGDTDDTLSPEKDDTDDTLSGSEKGDILDQKGDIAMSPEPSIEPPITTNRNHQPPPPPTPSTDPEPDAPAEPAEEEAVGGVLALLVDPEIGLSRNQARALLADHDEETLVRHAFAWLRDYRAGRVNGLGALLYRLRQGFAAPPLTADDRRSPLYRRHIQGRRSWIPPGYEEIINR